MNVLLVSQKEHQDIERKDKFLFFRDTWEALLRDIIELSRKDVVGDQWVAVISEIMKSFPDKATFNFDLSDQECEGFSAGVQELRKTVKKHNDTTLLPLESCFLGRSALKLLIGDIPNPPKCFNLVRKAKSARLKQELLEKGAQWLKNKKGTEYSGITGCRSGCRRPFDETSTSYPSFTASTSGGISKSNVGFLKSNPVTMNTAAIMGSRLSNRRETNIKMLTLEEQSDLKKRKKTTLDDGDNTEMSINNKKTTKKQQSQNEPSASSQIPTNENNASENTDNVLDHDYTTLSLSTTKTPYTPMNFQDISPPSDTLNPPVNDFYKQVRFEQKPLTNFKSESEQQQLQQTNLSPSPGISGLKLTPEQIEFAKDLFRTSTCLSRTDKSRILGFIAGARDRSSDADKSPANSLVTIKLSEKEELSQDPNGGTQQCFAEFYFQMNYATGEWRRIKKLRPLT
ncbi:unnamed protein product [Didymodactylos carnosus]|uniref:HDAg domain-containing protein n=1 Tax=Didymodactylos carnosus TaxID=1234261 RepID=A0A813VG94_9BILA|nr:unnamed protein product [Didymodactylos carnosus]CAF3632584.1 unnamed protein product [Didymodactylos carnosus]